MHALMAAVLLRMTRLDPFKCQYRPEPPDRKFAQVKQGMAEAKGTPLSLRCWPAGRAP